MLVYSVEQCFDVHLAVVTCLVEADLDVSSWYHFAVQRSVNLFSRIVEVQFFRYFFQSGIEKNILSVQDDDRVDDVFKITNLMG